MFSRLVAFGCSHSYGMGLADCYNRITKFAGDQPSRLAWPQLLADHMNIECVNLSRPGNSCKGIWNDVISADLTSTDLVVIMWTHASRWCIFKDGDIEDIAYYMDSPKSNNYFKSFYDPHDANMDLNLRLSHVSMHLDSKHVKNYHTIYKLSDYKPLDFNRACVLDRIPCLNKLKLSHPRGSDNKHPGELAHAEFAKNLHAAIQELI